MYISAPFTNEQIKIENKITSGNMPVEMTLQTNQSGCSNNTNVRTLGTATLHVYILCCFALFFSLACFFLPSFSSLIKTCMYMYIHERCRRKEAISKQSQTNNKAKQHSIPKAVTFPKKNELPRVGLEPTTLYTLDRACIHACACSNANKIVM